ncbi:SMI1/KNR4 family protein [Photorhabdus antumapuensis]|uniref:SMI1/KNR4 family protein n=1 Tax=Photorhabdus antumapuensis TaxID=2862867 RepID=UPI001CED2A35|nr:SMI1/KNR4 family protein [Photorhabdus antumapuensis]MCA6222365.1 SMI1/KNR4 family protein [Photorhabdus antumapuensis]
MWPLADKLLSICSNDLSSVKSGKYITSVYEPSLIDELSYLLTKKNGFYGFESALRVFPYETVSEEIGLIDWNNSELWIDSYEDMAKDALFFAEDIFGNQFCLKGDYIYTFDPETGLFDKLAENINEWCGIILQDYEVLTGYSLAHSWQKINGPIQSGYRLIPKVPFVAGGEYKLENLYLARSFEAMRIRANFALQIRNISDGDSIKIGITDWR